MQESPGNANNLWVFREGKSTVPAGVVLRELDDATRAVTAGPASTESIINALLRAGEFESALADSIPTTTEGAESLTSLLARCLWEEDRAALSQLPKALAKLNSVSLPETLRISPPEGFAYYALHPLDFAAMVSRVAHHAPSAAIIGIRSIGTTLSAIVLGALQNRGIPAERITVRPTGHPYDRTTRLSADQVRWTEDHLQHGSAFLVVDEGPGRSGSSFLSVAEALEATGVPLDRITLMGSRPINPDELCATNGPARWRRFKFVWPSPARYARFYDDIYIGGGDWREVLLQRPQSGWPCCWPQMERFKFLSADRKWIYKFEGFGRYGEDVLRRALHVAEAGFGPPAEYAGDGMIATPRIRGEVLDATCTSQNTLDRLADYCAFRASEFRIQNSGPSQLGEMLRFNVQQEFGAEINVDLGPLSVTTTLADGRMQPHEWIISEHGRMMKFDACTHGDDHFFPGPTDVAWDLAATIVEWELEKDAADFLLSRYYRLTGDNATLRIRPFLLAYSIFRMGYCKMALSSVVGTADFDRLQRAANHYRAVAERHLQVASKPRDRASIESRTGPLRSRSPFKAKPAPQPDVQAT